MNKPEFVLEKEAYKIIWDFETQTEHLIPARRSDHVVINKKKELYLMDFAVQADHGVKIKENENIDKYLDIARELTKQTNCRT